MGNCTSEQARLLRIGDLSGDPTAFRVFVKKRNKFIPGLPLLLPIITWRGRKSSGQNHNTDKVITRLKVFLL